jgi:hypothetical protein
MIGTIPSLPIYLCSVTFILSEISLEVGPVCLQFHHLVSFDVLSQDVKFCGVNVWLHLKIAVKELEVYAS